MKVAEAVAKPDNAPLAEAVLAARVPVGNAAVALTEMDKLLPRLTPACAETVLARVRRDRRRPTGRPRSGRCDRGSSPGTGGLGEFQRREDLLKHGRSLSQPYADDGMAEYRLRLDPEGQAVLEAILGPLAAPQPSTVTGSDLRTSDQRRADALVEVCRRAAAAGGSAPTTPKAAVVVTMDYQDLKEPDRGRDDADRGPPGSGDGPADGLRRRASSPPSSGTRSELLDLGRTCRLATPKLLQALCLRDRGCTFPGCSRPPGWCDAHHGVHWCDGGPTDLSNMALLCPRHHTIVHQKGYTATITTTEVTWHL